MVLHLVVLLVYLALNWVAQKVVHLVVQKVEKVDRLVLHLAVLLVYWVLIWVAQKVDHLEVQLVYWVH